MIVLVAVLSGALASAVAAAGKLPRSKIVLIGLLVFAIVLALLVLLNVGVSMEFSEEIGPIT